MSRAALLQQRIEFAPRPLAQGSRCGARELASIERRPQPHDPQPGRKWLHAGIHSFGAGADLTLDQIARHGAARVTFRDDRAEPDARLRAPFGIDAGLFIHRLLTSRFSICG